MSIEGQGHFLTLALEGHVHTKIQSGFSQKLLCRSEPNFVHGQETRDYSASFPFLNWRPPLRLIDQLAIYFLVFLC